MRAVHDRETTAHRLLQSSAKLSYDPDVDIDWAAPLPGDMLFIPEQTVSLYGTERWARMSAEQRIELSRQELINTVSVGIWFELILMQLLLRMSYRTDPTTAHVRYALTEAADECRHSTVFATLIARVGGRPYRNPAWLQHTAHALPLLLRGPSMWVATLIGEEVFDALQREHLRDDDVQPLVRAVMRIHVTEEARHVRYARQDLLRVLPGASRANREFTRLVVAVGAVLLSRILTRPEQYRRAGVPDPRAAAATAWANPHRRETVARAATKLTTFLDGAGLIGGPSRLLWRYSGLLR